MYLIDIYKIFEQQVASIDFACHKGCSTCCTRSVNITTLEGQLIIDHLSALGKEFPLLPAASSIPRPEYTDNGLAAIYLGGREPEGSGPDTPWVFEPCYFLDEGCCGIYEVRPFSCRRFGSTINCGVHGTAEVPGWFISMTTVISQAIEDRDRGGKWGNMAVVLQYLRDGSDKDHRLLDNQPLPGFLVPPEDRFKVLKLLDDLREKGVGSGFLTVK